MKLDKKTTLLFLLIIGLIILGESLRHNHQENGDEGEVINPFANLSARPRIDNPVPEFSLQKVDGEQVSIDQFRGKPVIINFWATWCAPCLVEMPLLQEIAERYPDDLVILAVNMQESTSSVNHFMDENRITFPILMDEQGQVANIFGVYAYPASFFVDKQGIIRSRHIGQLNEILMNKYLSTIGISQ